MEHWCCWDGTDGALVPLLARGWGGYRLALEDGIRQFGG
jgi:hypothetical protein